jgi:pimeloyl-ACP methyl ester carboxylesterase
MIILSKKNITQTSKLVNKTVLHTFSSGSKIPVLLLNGTPFSYQSFLPLIMNISDKYCVYVYDIRGMGENSDVQPLPTSSTDTNDICKQNLHVYIQEMREIINVIKNETGHKVNLFGWSWGGLQACRYTQLYPEDVNSLLLTACRDRKLEPNNTFIDFSNKLETYIQQDKNETSVYPTIPKEIVEYNMGRWFSPEDINTPSYITAKSIVEKANLKTYKNTVDILANINISTDWKQTNIPVLLLKANQDVTKEYMDKMELDMKKVGMKVNVINKDGKHPYYIMHADQTAKYIKKFI